MANPELQMYQELNIAVHPSAEQLTPLPEPRAHNLRHSIQRTYRPQHLQLDQTLTHIHTHTTHTHTHTHAHTNTNLHARTSQTSTQT